MWCEASRSESARGWRAKRATTRFSRLRPSLAPPSPHLLCACYAGYVDLTVKTTLFRKTNSPVWKYCSLIFEIVTIHRFISRQTKRGFCVSRLTLGVRGLEFTLENCLIALFVSCFITHCFIDSLHRRLR